MFRFMPGRALTEPAVALEGVGSAGSRATAVLRIEGLVCSACAARVRRRPAAVDGVQSASVDVGRGEALIAYDPACAGPEQLVSAAEGAVLFRPLRRLLAASGRLLATTASR